MACGGPITKLILFAFNILYVFLGLSLFCVGIAVQIRVGAVLSLIEDPDLDLQMAPIATIVLGALAFFVSYFGCCTIIKETVFMLISYPVILLTLVLAKLILAVVVFVARAPMVESVPKVLAEVFSNDTIKFEAIQMGLQCCGTTGADSYADNALPLSCCDDDNDCTNAILYCSCTRVLIDSLTSGTNTIGFMALTIAAFELVAAIIALCMAHHRRNFFLRSQY